MTKSNEVQQPTINPAQLVYIVTRWGQIYGVYSSLDDAQQIQRLMIAKNNVCDIQVHQVRTEISKS